MPRKIQCAISRIVDPGQWHSCNELALSFIRSQADRIWACATRRKKTDSRTNDRATVKSSALKDVVYELARSTPVRKFGRSAKLAGGLPNPVKLPH